MLGEIWESYLQRYIHYSGFSDRKEKEGLPYFRDKLFISILLLTFVLGSLSYVPSTYVAVSRNENIIVVLNTSTMLVLIFTVFYRGLSFYTKKILFSINFLVLSIVMFAVLGFEGNGSVLIFALSILITLFNGKKHGLFTILIIAIFYAILLFGLYFELFNLPLFEQSGFQVLGIIIVNNLLFNLLLVFSVSFLINQLHTALLKGNELQAELYEKHNNVLEAKNRVEKSDKLKSAFLANMSHEIRTPMYGILGCAQFLKEYNEDDENYQEYIEVIETSGEQLLDIMTDIINISIIESGLMFTNIRMFNIADNINTVYNAFLPEAHEKGLEFILNNTIAVQDTYISSDSDKVTSVLKYLIKNAIKYTDEGTIELTCERQDESYIVFNLKDTGIGIHEDNFENIFETFYQVDVENENALHGSGIGLAIAKAYIEMLGGSISLKSEVDIGTSFLFTMKVNLA
ncbi:MULTISPECIES: HAMP domain-containing sensor histidine kinase [unclassified Algibacter]|uniref:sensor histidine kinase n=1 Tax=unclassified Algibacter TaxID=2615009 RepID=UPI00131DE0A0|nr:MULTISPECIES: ATP-binding protein [unclassified Algibacter]MCL5130380.1 ATP-binding protein [Algibacter sp. L4_22]